MKRLIALGIFLIVGIELLALILHDRRLVLAGSGLALALVLLNVRRMLGNRDELTAAPDSDDRGGRVAPVALQHRDDDPVVGVHSSRLGPAFASDARTTVRNRHRP